MVMMRPGKYSVEAVTTEDKIRGLKELRIEAEQIQIKTGEDIEEIYERLIETHKYSKDWKSRVVRVSAEIVRAELDYREKRDKRTACDPDGTKRRELEEKLKEIEARPPRPDISGLTRLARDADKDGS